MFSSQALLDQVFDSFLADDNASELVLAQPIITHRINSPQDTDLVRQTMAYHRFVYLNLQGKLWILCLGHQPASNGMVDERIFQVDLALFRILSNLSPADVVVPIKARLRSSRTFYYSVLCSNSDNELCFATQSKYHDLLQAFPHKDKLNSFWVPQRCQHVDIQDGHFHDVRRAPGFFQEEAVPFFVNLVNSVILASN